MKRGRDRVRALLLDVAERSARYLERLDERAVAPPDAALRDLEHLAGDLPARGCDPAELIQLLDEYAAPATIASAGPRYFGFVTGGALPAALAANWLAGAWDQNAFSIASSPVGAKLESITLGWLRDLLKLPDGAGGAFVTGATMANFTALAAARQAVLAARGWDVRSDGLIGAPLVTIVVGEEAHASVHKALGLLGFGRNRAVVAPADGEGRIQPRALPSIEAPAIVCLQAGNVNSGAIDPAPEIVPWAREHDAWIHVDGAFGLWAAAAPGRTSLVAGFDAVGSWALDCHKWLNVPYDSALAFVRDPEPLRAAMAMSADYLVAGEARDPFDFTPEASRRMRAMEVWAALRSLGREGLAELIERNCRQAARFAQGFRDAGYQVLNDVVLNQVVVSFGPGDRTTRVVEAVQNDGTCWCGATRWRGTSAMRVSVSSWATADEDVERSLVAIIRIADSTR